MSPTKLYGKNMWCAAKSYTVSKYNYFMGKTRKPCSHALAFIAKLSREVKMEEFVHEYFSVERFRKAYAGTFSPMTSKDEWPKPDLDYKIHKPKLRRKPRRPRNSRIKPYDEVSNSKKRRTCPECGEVSHTAKHCQGGPTASQKKMIKYSQQSGQEEEHTDPNASASATRGRGRGRGSTSLSGSNDPIPSANATKRGVGGEQEEEKDQYITAATQLQVKVQVLVLQQGEEEEDMEEDKP